MIRVGFLIDYLESLAAGTERQMMMLIRELDRTEFTPFLYCLRPTSFLEQFTEMDWKVLNLKGFTKTDTWKNIFRFTDVLKNDRIDILQTHWLDSNIAGAVAAMRTKRTKVIMARKNQGYSLGRLHKLVIRVTDHGADHFVTNSHDIKRGMMTDEGVPENKISVIYNGLDLSSVGLPDPAKRKAVRASLGLADHEVAICLVGNLRPVKQIKTLVRAAGIMKESTPNARFFVAGEGNEREMLQDMANELGVAETMTFLGSRGDIPELLTAMDIGTLTSMSEGFSNSIVEYMAAGLPVVCTDVGGCGEAVEQNVSGRLVPVGDSDGLAANLSELCADQELRATMARAAHARAQTYSKESYARNYEAMYRKVLSGG